MESHNYIRENVPDTWDFDTPEPEIVGAWKDSYGERVAVRDERFSDGVVTTDERYTVEHETLEDISLRTTEDVVEYLQSLEASNRYIQAQKDDKEYFNSFSRV